MPTRRRAIPDLRLQLEKARSWRPKTRLCRQRFAHADFNLLWLGFWLLLQLQLEHSCIVAGADVLGVHSGRQSEGAIEAAIAAFDAMEVLFLLLFLELALALDGERVVFHAYIKIFFFDARNFELENDLFGVLINIDCRS